MNGQRWDAVKTHERETYLFLLRPVVGRPRQHRRHVWDHCGDNGGALPPINRFGGNGRGDGTLSVTVWSPQTSYQNAFSRTRQLDSTAIYRDPVEGHTAEAGTQSKGVAPRICTGLGSCKKRDRTIHNTRIKPSSLAREAPTHPTAHCARAGKRMSRCPCCAPGRRGQVQRPRLS